MDCQGHMASPCQNPGQAGPAGRGPAHSSTEAGGQVPGAEGEGLSVLWEAAAEGPELGWRLVVQASQAVYGAQSLSGAAEC